MTQDPFVTSSLEIRAPLPYVLSLSLRLESAMAWLWAPAQVADPASTRDLPDGARQLIVRDGDKLRTRVASHDERQVVLETSYRPRNSDVPGRELRYELDLEPGPGTTVASLSLHFTSDAPNLGPGDVRRWKRNVSQCLERLAALAAQGDAEVDGADVSD